MKIVQKKKKTVQIKKKLTLKDKAIYFLKR